MIKKNLLRIKRLLKKIKSDSDVLVVISHGSILARAIDFEQFFVNLENGRTQSTLYAGN